MQRYIANPPKAVIILAVIVLLAICLAECGRWSPALDILNLARAVLTVTALLLGLACIFACKHRPLWGGVGIALMLAGASETIPQHQEKGCASINQSPKLRILWFNLGGADEINPGLLGQVIALKPDLIGLAEARDRGTNPFLMQLTKAYPATFDCTASGHCSTVIFSRLPATSNRFITRGDTENRKALSAVLVQVAVPGTDAKVPVYATHLSWPVPFGRQRRELRKLAPGKLGPRAIVMGDFNMTSRMFGLKAFISRTGLRAIGSEPTWPMRIGQVGVFPIWQIDQILVGRAWSVASVSAVTLPGSDHRALLAELCLTK